MEDTKRPRASRAEWAKRVERWKDSGLTAEEFASEVGINPRTLIYWKYILGRAARGDGSSGLQKPRKAAVQTAQPRFIEVTPPASAGPRASLVLEAPGGYRLVIPDQFRTEQLSQVLAALERRQ